jgi:CRISPR-associated protein Cas2
MLFLIAYDIADARRLRRVARLLERRARRCQKSVFIFKGDVGKVNSLLDEAQNLMRPDEDVIQAWALAANQPATTLVRGTPLPVTAAGVLLATGQLRLIRRAGEDTHSFLEDLP